MNPNLTPASRQIEAMLDSGRTNPLDEFMRQQSLRQLEMSGAVPSNYDIFAVRRNDQVGDEVFGPKCLHVGHYSEEALYGIAGSPLLRFRAAIQDLKSRAEKASSADPGNVEYGHQVSLVWAEVSRLKGFMGSSPVISEIVAELRTARFQFLGKEVPISVMRALFSALSFVTESKHLDTTLVDRIVDVLEEGGIDSLAPDVLRDPNG